MQGVHPFERGGGLNDFSRLLLGDTQIIQALQVDPEFGARAEEMSQAQRRVRRDVAVSVQDLRDAIRGNLQMACQCGGAHMQFLQFLGQMFAGMNG